MAIYLKYDDIPGNVTTKGFEKQIELSSCSFNAGRAMGMSKRSAVNRGYAEPHLSEISVPKIWDDTASVKLLEDAIAGVCDKKAVISFTTTSKNVVLAFLTLELEEAVTSNLSTGGGGESPPSESLNLNYTKIAVTPYEVKDGKATKKDIVNYSLPEMQANGWSITLRRRHRTCLRRSVTAARPRPQGENTMLTTAMLRAASAYDARKMSHDILPELCRKVDSYNLEADGSRQIPVHDRAMRLQEIMILAGRYLTLKPPQDKRDTDGRPLHTKNIRRWVAMQQLAEDAAREAMDFGILMLHGQTSMRKVDGKNTSIWLEVVDPLHRHGEVLSGRYGAWLKGSECRINRLSFWACLDNNSTSDQYNQLVNNQVQYEPDNVEAARVVFNEQDQMTDLQGHPIDTWDMPTAESSPHWGIFVYTTDAKLFIHEHAAVPSYVIHRRQADHCPG